MKLPIGSNGLSSSSAVPTQNRVTYSMVVRELCRNHFTVLSTVGEAGVPHSAGVNYGIALQGRNFTIYVMTRRHLQKARNIGHNPAVSLVVPVARRLLQFLPPATIQLHGRAEILDWTDTIGGEVFGSFWMGRRILEAYQASHRRGETRICFLKITPDPTSLTYMVGYNILELKTRMESGAASVRAPREDFPSSTANL